jgi:hypothetical protein
MRRRFGIPTGTKGAIFQLNLILYEANVVFGAPERLTAFGARTFLVISQQK